MDFVFFDAKKTPIIIIYIDYFYSLTDAFRRCHDADDQYHGHYQNSYLENVRKDQNPLVLTSMMIVVGVQMAVMTKWPLVVSGQWTWMKFRWNFNEVTLSLWTRIYEHACDIVTLVHAEVRTGFFLVVP